jgi:predicted nuclease of predicted toxin-antitoxin system
MILRFLIDMNLSPKWVQVFERNGYAAVHWQTLGAHDAPDIVLMSWARDNNHVVFTHDLDFGMALALTQASGPSVIQVRTQNVFPSHLEPMLMPVVREHATALSRGALLIIDEQKARVRILPLQRTR